MKEETEYTRDFVRTGLVPILDSKAMPMKRRHPKINRNDNCPCGSGKKYKKCCLLKK